MERKVKYDAVDIMHTSMLWRCIGEMQGFSAEAFKSMKMHVCTGSTFDMLKLYAKYSLEKA